MDNNLTLFAYYAIPACIISGIYAGIKYQEIVDSFPPLKDISRSLFIFINAICGIVTFIPASFLIARNIYLKRKLVKLAQTFDSNKCHNCQNTLTYEDNVAMKNTDWERVCETCRNLPDVIQRWAKKDKKWQGEFNKNRRRTNK